MIAPISLLFVSLVMTANECLNCKVLVESHEKLKAKHEKLKVNAKDIKKKIVVTSDLIAKYKESQELCAKLKAELKNTQVSTRNSTRSVEVQSRPQRGVSESLPSYVARLVNAAEVDALQAARTLHELSTSPLEETAGLVVDLMSDPSRVEYYTDVVCYSLRLSGDPAFFTVLSDRVVCPHTQFSQAIIATSVFATVCEHLKVPERATVLVFDLVCEHRPSGPRLGQTLSLVEEIATCCPESLAPLARHESSGKAPLAGRMLEAALYHLVFIEGNGDDRLVNSYLRMRKEGWALSVDSVCDPFTREIIDEAVSSLAPADVEEEIRMHTQAGAVRALELGVVCKGWVWAYEEVIIGRLWSIMLENTQGCVGAVRAIGVMARRGLEQGGWRELPDGYRSFESLRAKLKDLLLASEVGHRAWLLSPAMKAATATALVDLSGGDDSLLSVVADWATSLDAQNSALISTEVKDAIAGAR